jgi:hypothetical protein
MTFDTFILRCWATVPYVVAALVAVLVTYSVAAQRRGQHLEGSA